MLRVAVSAATILFGVISPVGQSLAEQAPVRLIVEPGSNRESAVIGLKNTSESPVIVYLDRRFAQIELRGKRGSLGRCPLPADAIPRRPDDRRFVKLSPGEQVSEPFDLRFHCFGRRLSKLSKARAIRVRYRNRFRTDRLGNKAWTRSLGPVTMTFDENETAESPEAGAEQTEVADQSVENIPIKLRSLSGHRDVARATYLNIILQLRGPLRGRLPVAIRPELFSFQVMGPNGRIQLCQLPTSRVRPLREFYSHLGQRRMNFELSPFCPHKTFNVAGVYEVTPLFSATFDGHDVGLKAWVGCVEGRPFFVRVRRAGRQASDPVEIRVPAVAGGGNE